MSRSQPKNVAASIRQRLLNIAQEKGEDFQLILIRYGLERFLYRLSKSAFNQQYILKGATLFSVWEGDPHRPTMDADFLGYGDNSIEELERITRAICDVSVKDDGLQFLNDTVAGGVITENEEYQGIRLNFYAKLAAARIPLQIDMAFGDAVTPRPKMTKIPTLLDLPAPRLRTYPPETVISEKFEILVDLGMANSRMKDFYDIWTLSQRFRFEGTVLQEAIQKTFHRRRTAIPKEPPVAVTADFIDDAGKQTQWAAFLRKNQLEGAANLAEVMAILWEFLRPPAQAILNDESFSLNWEPGGPWK